MLIAMCQIGTWYKTSPSGLLPVIMPWYDIIKFLSIYRCHQHYFKKIRQNVNIVEALLDFNNSKRLPFLSVSMNSENDDHWYS